MNTATQAARVAKWQPQRTQNPPPSKGMKVRVLSRALAAMIADDAQATPGDRALQRAQATTAVSEEASTSANTSTEAQPRFDRRSL